MIPAALLDRCFIRMAAWVRLLVKSIQAEFPSWELSCAQLLKHNNKLASKFWLFCYWNHTNNIALIRLNSFQAFCLDPQPSEAKVQTCLDKLAMTYKLDPHQVSAEYYDFRRFALSIRSNFGSNSMSNFKSWEASLKTCKAGQQFRCTFFQDFKILFLME